MSEGIKETKEVVAAVVAIVKAVDQAKNSNGGIGFDDVSLLLPLYPPVAAAIQDVNKVGVELKDLDSAEIAELAAAALSGFAPEGKLKVYIEEGLVLLDLALKGTASVKKILAA